MLVVKYKDKYLVRSAKERNVNIKVAVSGIPSE